MGQDRSFCGLPVSLGKLVHHPNKLDGVELNESKEAAASKRSRCRNFGRFSRFNAAAGRLKVMVTFAPFRENSAPPCFGLHE
jgi:hypothetical protein